MRTLGLALMMAVMLTGVARAAYVAPFPARAHWSQSGDIGAMVLGPRAMTVLRMDGTITAAVSTDEDISLVDLAADGSRLAYATGTKVHIILADGTVVASLPAMSCLSLHWSANAAKLLYTAIEDGAVAGQKRLVVYTVDADGTNKKSILSQSYASTGP